MNIEELREYCLQFPASEECFPFDDKTLVFKVKGKMFALTYLYKSELKVNLKFSEDYCLKLREEYSEIEPGFHMHKKYWNTVNLTGNLSDDFIKNIIKVSYKEVVNKLTNKQRSELQNFGN